MLTKLANNKLLRPDRVISSPRLIVGRSFVGPVNGFIVLNGYLDAITQLWIILKEIELPWHFQKTSACYATQRHAGTRGGCEAGGNAVERGLESS